MANISQQYDQDFYAWTKHNAKLIRQGKLSEIDAEHLAEEIESMGKSERRELMNRLAILIAHLVKWQFQPAKRGRSGMLTIKNQRFDIADLLDESPSLRSEIAIQCHHAYEKALIIASEQTGLDEDQLPPSCPFSLDQCLDATFLPQ